MSGAVQVDLTLAGHDHKYERTCSVYKKTCLQACIVSPNCFTVSAHMDSSHPHFARSMVFPFACGNPRIQLAVRCIMHASHAACTAMQHEKHLIQRYFFKIALCVWPFRYFGNSSVTALYPCPLQHDDGTRAARRT